MECGLCGTMNRAGARFCGGCGSPLAQRCANCKAELDAALRFCDQCGTPVTDEASISSTTPTTAAAPLPDRSAVRKTVTVLFADLGGSTGFGERTDAEVSRQVLARYHALLQDAIDAHGGTVAKFMGDGMMATFGIPAIAEDDAERAVRAGIEIQDRFEQFASEVAARYGETLTARVGVNTGEVVIAAGDADLVGDALNVAARLEKACRPGHVLVGDETWRITRGVLVYEPLGEVSVAGRAQPVGTYEVAASETAAAEPVAPFVGRGRELERLRVAFDRARVERSAVLVTILGSPGLGKTRLSRELAALVGAHNDATTFEIRCDRSGGSTFAPIAELIREAAGLEDTDADGRGASTYDRIGALLHVDDRDRARIVEVLAGVVGPAPARSVEETFWAIRRAIESLAIMRPLVVVIDDTQWAEPKLLDLLEHLAEWVTSAPVLLVCLARPELRELRPALTEPGRRVADVLALDGLDSSATAELAAGLLGSPLPRDLVDRLPASTDGNPLFVRELVRMLVDDAVIRRGDDGAWELAIDAEAVEVPPTIQSLLAARVERLPVDELRVLEFASVVGAEFSVGALRELLGDDAPIPTLLERMRRKELVEPTSAYWGDEPIHRFHHVLIRDAAYRRLLKGTRAELHQRVGMWTDASAGHVIGEHETAIAFHYEQANRYRTEIGIVDDETDRLGRRAAELLRFASKRALDRDDLASAGALTRRALAVLPTADSDDRSDLLLVACECFLASGDVVTGAPLVDEFVEAAGADEQHGAWAACFRAQLVGLTDPDALRDADGWASAAADTLRRLGDGAGEAKAHQVRAGLLARLGRVGEAEAVLDLALGAARASDDRRRVTAVLGAAPQAALFGPSPVARAGGRCLDVVRLLRITTASPSVEATSMRCQAVLEALRGRFDVSRSMLASARASLEELGLRHGLLETDLFTGMVELIAGDASAAIAPLRAAYEGLGTLGVGADAGQAAALLASALLERGDVDGADAMAAASEELAGQNLKTAIAWRVARARVLAARGDVAQGLALGEAAVEIAAATDLVLDHADACVALADLRERAHDAAGARTARADALNLYEAKGATVPAQRLSTTDASEQPVAAAPARELPRPEASSSRATATRTALAENAASRATARFAALVSAGRFDETRSLFPANHVWVDRRRTVSGAQTTGWDEMIASVRSFAEVGFANVVFESIAVRGDRLQLYRAECSTDDGRELVVLCITELDESGLAPYTAWYDEDDLGVALGTLDARYVAGEGAEHARVLKVCGRLARATGADGAPDYDAIDELLAPGYVLADHQRLGFGVGGRDLYIEATRSRGAVASNEVTVYRSVEVVGNALLALQDQVVTTEDGSRYSRIAYYLTVVDDNDRVSRTELFDDDQYDNAVTRLHELGTRGPDVISVPDIANTATRAFAGGLAEYEAGDFETGAAGIAPDVTLVDRRIGPTLGELQGRDLFVDNLRRIYELFGRIDVDVIAVRGERLAVTRTRFVSADGFETVEYDVIESNERGLIETVTAFGDADLDAALDELDERYIAGEGAAHEYMIRRGGDFRNASAARDWIAFAALLADDFVFTDHRSIGLPDNDRTGYIAVVAASVDQTPDMRMVARTLEIRGNTTMSRTRRVGTTTEGFAYEWEQIAVGQSAAGLIRRIELFPVQQAIAARARFEELARDVLTPNVDSRMVRGLARLSWLTQVDPENPPAFYSADAVLDDRRAGVNAGEIVGAERVRQAIVAGTELFGALVTEPRAVRGDRLTMYHWAYVQEGGFEAPGLTVIELDDDDLACRVTSFDEGDVAIALAFMNARYRELTGHAATVEHDLFVGFDAINRGDWAAFEATLPADLVAIDHRPLGFEPADRDAFVDGWMRGFVALVSNVVMIPVKAYERGSTVLARIVSSGTTADGSRYEWDSVVVTRNDGASNARIEFFSVDQWADAVMLFDEWTRAVSPPANSSPIANEATGFADRYETLIAERRFDEAMELIVPEYTLVDHRFGGVTPATRGPAGFLEQMRAYGAVGLRTISHRHLATRGERLALGQQVLESPEGFVTTNLNLTEIDASGRFTRTDIFAEDDLGVALRTLEEWYVEGEGAEHALMVQRVDEERRAYAAGDGAAVAACYTTDAVIVNHRRLGWPMATPADLGDRVSQTRGIAEVNSTIGTHIECRGDASLEASDQSLTIPEGSTYSTVIIGVRHLTAGLFDVVEFFDLEDLPAARARFEELAVEPRNPTVDNHAARTLVHWSWLLRHGERRDADDLLADSVAVVDRRLGVSLPAIEGRTAYHEAMAATSAVFPGLNIRPVAARGDRLALLNVIRSSDGFELSNLGLIETDRDGRVRLVTIFDLDARDAAVEELDTRHLAIMGEDARAKNVDRANAVTELLGPQAAAFAARDWDWIRSRLAVDIAVEDRRTTVNAGPAVGRESVIALFRGFADVGFETLDQEPIATRGDRLALLRRVYRSATGFELAMLAVAEANVQGLAGGLVLFDLDELDAALAELDARFERIENGID